MGKGAGLWGRVMGQRQGYEADLWGRGEAMGQVLTWRGWGFLGALPTAGDTTPTPPANSLLHGARGCSAMGQPYSRTGGGLRHQGSCGAALWGRGRHWGEAAPRGRSTMGLGGQWLPWVAVGCGVITVGHGVVTVGCQVITVGRGVVSLG